MDSSFSMDDSSSSSSSNDSDYMLSTPRFIKPKSFQERLNVDFYDDLEFRRRFRMSKITFQNVVSLIRNNLENIDNRGFPLSPELKVLIALRFYATGCYQLTAADMFGVSQATVCRTVHKVSKPIAQLSKNYIKMPSTPNEIMAAKQSFYNKNKIPRVVGCIDGTHVPIQSPGGESAELFRNRKLFFSINVQAVMGADCKFLDIVARWHGSAHDQTILNFSKIKSRFERREFGDALLLGDAGYACTQYLLTPFRHPNTQPRRNFNRALSSTRSCVERGFGQWKRRFRVMGRKSEIKLKNLLPVIVATAVLHNICIEAKDELLEEDDDFVIVDVPQPQPNAFEAMTDTQVRDSIVRHMFGEG